MDVTKVLFISQEISPYLPDSKMALAGRNLPQAIQEQGVEVRTFMPNYGFINERRNQLHEVIRLSGMNIVIDDTDHPLIIKVATLQPARMQVYFIYNEDYFDHTLSKQLETESSPEDNDERSIFYVRGVLETVKKLRWIPEVIVCSGWITALVPLYIRQFYADEPTFANTKIVYNLYDDPLAIPFPAEFAKKLKFDGFDDKILRPIKGKAVDHVMLTKLAIQHSDAVVQCDPEIDPAIIKAVKTAKVPFMEYREGTISEKAPSYMEFFKSLE